MLVGHAFAALILEGVDGAAGGQEPLLEVFGADDAEMLRIDRLRSPHRREKLGDAVAVHPVGAEEARQRLMGAADLGQDLALNGGAGEPAELGDEFPHRVALPRSRSRATWAAR